MQKIEINLASSGGASVARLHSAFMIAGVCLAAVYTFYNWHVYRSNKEAIEVYRQRVAAIQAKSPQKEGGPARAVSAGVDMKALKRDVLAINEVIERKTFLWTNLLTGLELSTPPGVYLIQISPDFMKANVTVTGAASDMSGALSMVDRMGKSPYFNEVFLTRHSEEKGANRPDVNPAPAPLIQPQRPGMPPMQMQQGPRPSPQQTQERVIIFNITARYVAGKKI